MKVIYVDDEQPILDDFSSKVSDLSETESFMPFWNGIEALKWVEKNPVDVAFLDVEMPGMNGIELAKKLKQIDRNIRIIFVTAYEQYALDAFGVDALGYVLKPCSREEIQKELDKASCMRARPEKRIVIQTIPNFVISVDGTVIHLGGAKQTELMALLVDRAQAGLSSGEAISCLWPDRPADESTQILYRVTFHRLMEALRTAGIEQILYSVGRKKYIRTEQVDCDLYRILEGEVEALQNYGGEYMKDYSWSETRIAQLDSIRAGSF